MESFFPNLNELASYIFFFFIIVALGLCMHGWGGICADQHVF